MRLLLSLLAAGLLWGQSPVERKEVRDGVIRGRGAADDKGPLVQALLAMRTLADLHPKRTHTLRLLVGSDEESGSSDMAEYLKGHKPPDFSLVLDANFPVTVGEKAWVGYWIDAPLDARDPKAPLKVLSIDAGLAPSIVSSPSSASRARISTAPPWACPAIPSSAPPR